jgi:hypothetical protein
VIDKGDLITQVAQGKYRGYRADLGIPQTEVFGMKMMLEAPETLAPGASWGPICPRARRDWGAARKNTPFVFRACAVAAENRA